MAARKAKRRARAEDTTSDSGSDAPPVQRQLTMSQARRNAAVGAAMAAAQAVAVAPAAAPAAAAEQPQIAYARHLQTEGQAEAVRALAEEFQDAIIVEAKDFAHHGIVGRNLRVALLCQTCVRVRKDPVFYGDTRRQAKVYVARMHAHEARVHFETCESRDLERLRASRDAAGATPIATPNRGTPVGRHPTAQQQQRQQENLAHLSYWFVEHGVSLMGVSQFGKNVASKLGDQLPINVDWSHCLQAAAKESSAACLARLVSMPYTCLAFDGGKWSHTGQHMLVCVAANPSGVMVLPPVTQDNAWDAAATAHVIAKHRLDLKGTTIKHAVVDGAAYNGAAVDGMNVLAEFIAALGDDNVSAYVPGLTPHETDFVDAMGTALRGSAFGTIKQVLCLGHWVKNRVIQAHRKDSLAYQFLLNIERSLYGDGEQSTRRTILTKRLRAYRARAKTQGVAAFDVAIDALKALLNPRSVVPQTARWRANVAKQVRAALISPGAAGAAGAPDGDNDARAVSAEEALLTSLESGQGWKEDAQKLLEMLVEFRGVVQGESTAARTATLNQTRWHTSTFLSYVFALQNFKYLRTFYSEQKSTAASVKAIQDALNDPDTSATIERELKEYTSSMEPASRFLQAASENSPGLVMRMFPLLMELMEELSAEPAGSVGSDCGAVIREQLNFPIGDQRSEFTRTVNFFAYAHLLVPGVFITLADEFFRGVDLDASKVRYNLGFSDEELPTHEWDSFVEFQRLQHCPCDALPFWDSPRSDRWPQLRKIALYLYSAPAVVTTCDSIISVMGTMFSSRQARLADATAADLVAWRCNGNPVYGIDGSIRRGQ